MTFSLRPRAVPALADMSELLRAQLGPLYDQAEQDGDEQGELFELFDVLDEDGRHVFDMHLFAGDDGQVLRAGTLEHVATFSQGGVTGTKDEALRAALARAYAAVAQRAG